MTPAYVCPDCHGEDSETCPTCWELVRERFDDEADATAKEGDRCAP